MGATLLIIGLIILGGWMLLKPLSSDSAIMQWLLPTVLLSVPVVGAAGGEWLYQRGQAGNRPEWWRCGVAGWFWSMLIVLLYYIGTAGPASLGVILVVFCTYMVPIHGVVLALAVAGSLLIRRLKRV
jgi:hypothetical protein